MRRLPLALATASLTWCAACSRAPAPPSRTFVLGQSDTLMSFALSHSGRYAEAQFAPLVFEGLTSVDEDGRARPALATRWESRDLIRWRFHLRRGVRFHDGSAFGAADVVRAWRLALRDTAGGMSPPSQLMALLGAQAFADRQSDDLPGVRSVDDSTVEVTLQHAIAALPQVLTSDRAAVPAARNAPAHPLGSGPWRWVAGVPRSGRVVLAANASHYATRPVMDTLVLVTIAGEASVRDALLQGTVHAMELSTPLLENELRARRDLAVRSSPPMVLRTLEFNPTRAALQDVRVRKALLHALDLSRIAAQTSHARFQLANGAVPLSVSGADSTRAHIAYDPATARGLLAAAGYSAQRPLTLRLAANAPPQHSSTLRLMAEYWAAAGIDVRFVAGAGETTAADAPDVRTWLLWPGFADAEDFLANVIEESFAHDTVWRLPGDTPAPSLMRRLRTTRDTIQRARLAQRVDSLVMATLWRAPLWFSPSVTVHSTRLRGVPASLFAVRYERVTPVPGAEDR